MIPGKVFFQSIDVSEQMANKYELYLLLNGIFYDKIKPFQSKYLCLTANDVLEVQLGLKSNQSDKENINAFEVKNSVVNAKQAKNINKQDVNIPTSYLKVLIPQAYKIIIECKTIDVKFHLNRKNSNEEIKINLTFEPVASFSRKKLGATLSSNKTAFRNTSNFNQTHEKLAFSRRQLNQQPSGQSSIMNSPDQQYFPQKIEYFKNETFKLKSPEGRKSIERVFEGRSGLNRTLQGKRTYVREEQNKDEGETKKSQPKFSYLPKDIIIEDQPSSSVKFLNESKEEIVIEQRQVPRLRLDLMKQVVHQTPNIEMLSDILQNNQTYTSPTNNMFEPSQHKITEEKQPLELNKFNSNTMQYQTQGNLKSFETVSDHDTLEALAYQREKILGQLFGKLGTKTKK